MKVKMSSPNTTKVQKKNQKLDFDIDNYINPESLIKPKINFEIVKNTFFTYPPEYNSFQSDKSSFVEIAIISNDINNNQISELSHHLYKNELNEIYIFKYLSKEKKKEEDEITEYENKINNIPNLFEFACLDEKCLGMGNLSIDLNETINNNFNFIFKLLYELLLYCIYNKKENKKLKCQKNIRYLMKNTIMGII